MNKHFLKNIRDNLPEPIKFISGPLFRNKLLNNIHFKKYYTLLEESEKFSSDEVNEYQLNQLKDILAYSYQNVPYYTKLFDEISFDWKKISSKDDIKKIPFLTKELIKENFNMLTSTNKKGNGYYIATTGGSTGEPLKILLDYSSIFKETAFVYYFRKKLGYGFSDKLVTFRGVSFQDKLWTYNPMNNELIFSPFKLSKLTIDRYIERIERYQPQYLNGYLSCLYFFSKLLNEKNKKIKLNLKGIFLISENIDNDQRDYIEDFFGVRSTIFYGHSERCVIAEEENRGLYKISPFYGYTELIEEGPINEIVSTGFLNKTMPLIRYKTGDVCTWQNDLIAIQGRWNVEEYVVGINNEKISHSAINFHTNVFNNVTNYQFYQKEKGKCDLLLVVNKEFKPSQMKTMLSEIEKKMKGVIIFEIKIVDQMILSPRGKFKRFYLDLPNNETMS